jgi:endonuclease/exonuclease/phosphatase family metal-dependent hydrolase
VTLHAKSKFVRGGESMWRDPARRLDFVKAALEARRRISAEAMRVREYLNACFAQDEAAAVVVAGDLNDGPGTDYFERHYLTHNVAGMIAGSAFAPRRMLRHAFIDVMEKERNYTAIFDDFIDDIRDRKILLDHILVSPSLYWGADDAIAARGTIEHDVFEAGIDADARAHSRQRMPSDHRPQSVTLAL